VLRKKVLPPCVATIKMARGQPSHNPDLTMTAAPHNPPCDNYVPRFISGMGQVGTGKVTLRDICWSTVVMGKLKARSKRIGRQGDACALVDIK